MFISIITIIVCTFLQVTFDGELGVDTGGLEKEFWTVLYREILKRYFEGDGHAIVRRNVSNLIVRKN